MIELVIYFVALVIFFALTFRVLQGINVEGMFKKNRVWEIQAFYIIISIVVAHILAQVLLKFYEWGIIILN